MIEREIAPRLQSLFEQYPIVTVTGPRQSGKTTLCRESFPGLPYASLESPDLREFAQTDPRGFLAQFRDGAIIDEVQRVPDLLSYLQTVVDEHGGNSLFVLTGSEQFPLSDAISQSLAGRTALLRLLPFSLAEHRRIGGSTEIDDMIFGGFYPRILDQGLEPRQALRDYFETYVERDVRRLGGVRDLTSFGRFMRLCAGRIGQLVNFSSLGSDAGISHPTAREWLSILARSYIVFQLQPFHANISKRLIKSPKLYFHDVGLASYLLGIENSTQVSTHPLRGQLFENLAIAEALKHRFNRGRDPNLSFFRDQSGLECDLLYETGQGIAAIEVKSGLTIASDSFRALNRVAELVPNVSTKMIVYAGSARYARSHSEIVPLDEFGGMIERVETDQEVATFIRDQVSEPPKVDDVGTLDAAFSLHIRPTLAALESACEQISGALFRDSIGISFIKRGQTESNGSGLLQPEKWATTRNRYIVDQGFTLSDDRPLEIRHRHSLNDYNGRGIRTFSTSIVFTWSFDGHQLHRTADIDGLQLHTLESSVIYGDLEKRSPEVDRVNAVVSEALINRIRELADP